MLPANRHGLDDGSEIQRETDHTDTNGAQYVLKIMNFNISWVPWTFFTLDLL